MRAGRLDWCLPRVMSVPPWFDDTCDATSASSRGRRRQVGIELGPADDPGSYFSRRPADASEIAHRVGVLLRHVPRHGPRPRLLDEVAHLVCVDGGEVDVDAVEPHVRLA